jgi:excisionase family DNA binding protein
MPDPNGQLHFDRLLSLDEDHRDRLQTLLKPEDLRLILNVSRSWLYEAANAGRIPSIRLGPDGPLRFDPDAIERWLERRGGVTPAS